MSAFLQLRPRFDIAITVAITDQLGARACGFAADEAGR